ncbi:enoyl-CoA hydratase/isomerase family protein [Streptomyces sp. TP-A0874]|uniref:enoyl-CoA hydratase/isomerase family protein n=1 Tax=Streptomyces sp. TP-A0874 TaxID=549819 RepID=UPI000853A1AA|nr:enoyl-CoA hydratase/isomerase family protein [Streptomyces sp. TP-A0874]
MVFADPIEPNGSTPSLHLGLRAGVATITIHHPAKRNAMTSRMWRELPRLLERLAADRAVRMLLLTGADGTFCAGADISELGSSDPATGEQQPPTEPAEGPQGLAAAAEAALAAFPKPTLAVVRGHCVGGGCQLAVACDLRFAAEDALFGITPARLGVVYPAGATRRLATLVGPAAAKYLLFSAELVDAERALRTGLVDEVLPGSRLDDRVARFTELLTSRSLLSQSAAKEFVGGPATPERIAYWSAQEHASGDTAEGVAAFLERRAPRFDWPAEPGSPR